MENMLKQIDKLTNGIFCCSQSFGNLLGMQGLGSDEAPHQIRRVELQQECSKSYHRKEGSKVGHKGVARCIDALRRLSTHDPVLLYKNDCTGPCQT